MLRQVFDRSRVDFSQLTQDGSISIGAVPESGTQSTRPPLKFAVAARPCAPPRTRSQISWR